MKLVMSATTPLALDQIRVALSVVDGEPVWHPEKIPQDGMQLIALCGGNLLELDEEDGKIRFIHHSVIQHLLSPALNKSTTPYHFTTEDAENYIGAMCVTYLHFDVLDSRITVTKNLQSTKILDSVVDTTQRSLPVASRLFEHIKSRERRRTRPSTIDIGQIVTQILAARVQQDLDPRCLEDYATKNWAFHTKFFDEDNQDCKKSWRLWWLLSHGGGSTIKPPFPDISGEAFPVLMWAVEHGHGSLFRTVLSRNIIRLIEIIELIRVLNIRKSIHGPWLGDILAQFLQSLRTIESSSTADNIKILLDLEVNPCTPHHAQDTEPLSILADRICADSLPHEDEQILIRVVFAHSTVKKFLDDQSLLVILQKLDYGGKHEAVLAILAFNPALGAIFNQKGKRKAVRPLRGTYEQFGQELAVFLQGRHDQRANPSPESYKQAPPAPGALKPLIEQAMENQNWDYFEVCGREEIQYPTSSGTSLLWQAIQTMSDAWVYHLLKLGANPNTGPFTMQKYPSSSMSTVVNCFPLEAALRLRRTRVFLELLHGGAVVDRSDIPLDWLADKMGNWIISARLYEDTLKFGQGFSSGHPKKYYYRPTALSTACEMLSYSGIGEPPGFPRPLHIFDAGWDWASEIEKIIYRLALDGDGAYVNAQDTEGRTALHHLSEAKNTDAQRLRTMVNVLLSRGADPNLRDAHGKTPLELAISNLNPFDSTIEPLLGAGAYLMPGGSTLLEVMLNSQYRDDEERAMSLVREYLQAGRDPRDPLMLTSPAPTLIAAAVATGMEYLIQDFKNHSGKLNSSS